MSKTPSGRSGGDWGVRELRPPHLRRVGDRVQASCDNGHRVADIDQNGVVYILCRCKQLIGIGNEDSKHLFKGGNGE
jgi:hypothetical protein